ncbi:TolC family protein [Vibrio sp. YMD68]|uniref:TolC family protein n=1 Tax=Vibrio sp. YMD68 TaxID=3042300 RepID=UPI00249BA830|nr:TolC family protein [Vibrio sp. YMD68]WGV97998.1 TolC family protein [Vibrio sp. YMD68]
MMNRKLSRLILSLIAAGSFSTHAASNHSTYNSSTNTTDLENLYNLAIQNDPLLRTAELTRQKSSFAIDGEKGRLLPQINAYFNLSAFVDSESVESTYGGNGAIGNVGITLSQSIYTPAVQAGIAIAGKNNESAELLVTKAHEALIYRTTKSYFDVLRNQALLETAKANEEALGQYLSITQHRNKAGTSSEIDLLQAQARKDQSEVAVLEAEVQYQLALDALQTLSGQEFQAVQPLKTDSYAAHFPNSASGMSWLDASMSNNRDIQLAGVAVERSKIELSRAKAGHKPTISLQARLNQRFLGDIESTATGNSIDNNESLTSGDLALVMNVPIYSGSSLTAFVDIANSDVDIAYQILEQSRRETHQNIRFALRLAESSIKKVGAFQRNVNSQEKALISVQKGYELGARNMSEVLDSTRDYYLSESQLYNAYFTYIESALLVKFLAGEISDQDIRSLNASIKK